MELDHPAEAAQLLKPNDEEELKTNIPLAAEPGENLSEESALRLAEWYVGLVGRAEAGGRELMVARAKNCYRRFFSLHADREEALAVRASLGVQKIGGTVPPAKTKRPSRPRADLEPGEEITDLKLAEFVARHPDVTRLGRREIGSARLITDLRPLAYLDKLRRLELSATADVKDLTPLSSLPNLTSLSLTRVGACGAAGAHVP